MKFLKAVFIVLFIAFLIGCGGGGGGNDSSGGGGNVNTSSYANYVGHYKGTVRYDMVGYNEIIVSLEFDIGSDGKLRSFIIDGQVMDIDKAEESLISGSGIEENGVIKGQGSYNDPDFGIVNFTFNGLVTDDGDLDIIYNYSGGLVGNAEMICSRA